jgi:hypothetical protein
MSSEPERNNWTGGLQVCSGAFVWAKYSRGACESSIRGVPITAQALDAAADTETNPASLRFMAREQPHPLRRIAQLVKQHKNAIIQTSRVDATMPEGAANTEQPPPATSGAVGCG